MQEVTAPASGWRVIGRACAVGLIMLTPAGVLAQDVGEAELLAELLDEGQDAYERNCAGCHGDEGEGGGTGPGLAGNPFLQSNAALTYQIIVGYEDHGMPPFDNLSNRQIAAIATYVRNSWGNAFGITRPETVEANRPD